MGIICRHIDTTEFRISKIWKKYFIGIKLSKNLKKFFIFRINDNSIKFFKFNSVLIDFVNLLLKQKKSLVFEYVFILFQEETLHSFFLLHLYYYVKSNNKKGIEKFQLLKNHFNIFYKLKLPEVLKFYFKNEMEKSLYSLFRFKKYKFFFSHKNIFILNKKVSFVNSISNIYNLLYFIFHTNNFKILICIK